MNPSNCWPCGRGVGRKGDGRLDALVRMSLRPFPGARRKGADIKAIGRCPARCQLFDLPTRTEHLNCKLTVRPLIDLNHFIIKERLSCPPDHPDRSVAAANTSHPPYVPRVNRKRTNFMGLEHGPVIPIPLVCPTIPSCSKVSTDCLIRITAAQRPSNTL